MGWGRTRNRGKNNRIIITETDGTEKILSGRAVIPGLDLTFDGDGNVLRLQKPFVFDGCEMLLCGGSRFEMKSSRHVIEKASFCVHNRGSVAIGHDFSAQNGLQITGFDEKDLSLRIGDDCMFSYNVLIRMSDGHALYRLADGKLLNKAKGISIGRHVWAGMNAVFLKGAVVPDDCVVGACSTVTKAFAQPHSILAGIPARAVNKEPVEWARTPIDDYTGPSAR